jgi:hypothetical protein
MLVIKKQVDASAADTVNGSSEYRTVPLTELFESPTNPRKNFDKESLGELTASIRSKGVRIGAEGELDGAGAADLVEGLKPTFEVPNTGLLRVWMGLPKFAW